MAVVLIASVIGVIGVVLLVAGLLILWSDDPGGPT